MKNLIGNTLIVLILLMSVFFFAAALMVGAAQRNWKAEVAKLQERAVAAERQINDGKDSIKEQLKTLEREKVARAQQLANLFSQNRQISQQLVERNKSLKAEIESNQERLVNTDVKTSLREQFAKVKNLTQDTFEQQTKIDTLTETIADLNSALAVKTKVLTHIGVDDNFRTRDIVPKLTAVIAEIGSTRKTFAIKLGSDDGIRGGHEFDIYRGDRFIGRARVLKVRPDISILQTVTGLQTNPIEEGDYVTSEL